MQPFRDLAVWEKSHQLTLAIYRVSESFPRTETFGMAATLRLSSAQVAMRIAEACGQDSSSDFASLLKQARGICMNVEYQLLLAHDLEFIKSDLHDTLQAQVIEVRKMLSGLIKAAV